MKDLLNKVDKEHKGGNTNRNNIHKNDRKEMLKNVISPKRSSLLEAGTPSILSGIIGANKKFSSPKKSFKKDFKFDVKNALKTPKSGGFLDQMKKKHQERGSYYAAGGSNHLVRKKKQILHFSTQNTTT